MSQYKKYKKVNIFSVRLDDELSSALRRVSSLNCVSSGSVIRRVLRSYFVSKGYIK